MQGTLNDCRDPFVGHRARAARAVFVPFSGIYNALSGSGQPLDTVAHKPAPPFANGIAKLI